MSGEESGRREALLAHVRANAVRDQAQRFAGEPLFHVVLLEPEIPTNTGNIGRECVGMGARLHLVGPLGFSIDEKARRRAGLDYWDELDWRLYDDMASFLAVFEVPAERRWVATKWAARTHWEARFELGDALIFGRETTGIPESFPAEAAHGSFALPRLGPVRSYNLANSVGIAGFELLRQNLYERP
ncbi:MAG: tRNA (cytidine(34)-2'-O)-methyltransferase [Planctomycetes bacterium]|nr:tRNA (cytidine(34)-2'-O)-methyltransferase [Planctomycetota bacterium]